MPSHRSREYDGYALKKYAAETPDMSGSRKMFSLRRVLCGLGVIMAGSVSSTFAQVPVLRLGHVEARFQHELLSVTGFRAMSDGRVLVTDGVGGTFLRLDFATGRADTIGREGQGPGEYRSPERLLPMPEGATLLVDLGNGRLSLFDVNGQYQKSYPMARAVHGGRLLIVLPWGSDRRGRVYFQTIPLGNDPRDSARVVRYDLLTTAVDTIAVIKLPDVRVSGLGSSGGQSIQSRTVPLSPEDAWIVSPDGRLGVARAPEYRFQWIIPGGSTVTGPRVSWVPVQIREPDKVEWLEAQSSELGIGTTTWRASGNTTASFFRGHGGGPAPPPEAFDWPATKSPFVHRGVYLSVEGDAWVERTTPAGEPRSFDIFGVDAALKSRVNLPANRRLVGLGAGVVYLAEETSDGMICLERYSIR